MRPSGERQHEFAIFAGRQHLTIRPLRHPGLILLLAFLVESSWASVNQPALGPQQQSFAVREQQIWISAARNSKFASMQRASRPSCENTEPPQALATPNPLLSLRASGHKVTVSFIIGADGHVYSPLILESAGSSADRTVLNTVRSWRYRPATCNGVPTEAEGKIQFSSR